MKLNDKVMVNGSGYNHKKYSDKEGYIYDLADGASYPITVCFTNGAIDSFHVENVKPLIKS